MCSIFGSFNRNKILELNELNKDRGNFAYSISTINNQLNIIKQEFGELNPDDIPKTNDYILCHRSAPTAGLIKNYNNIHPAMYKGHYLYHNGMLKNSTIRLLESRYNENYTWDTYAILKDIVKYQLINSLNYLDGSFACIYINDLFQVFIFRNQSSIIYYDEDLNISSTSFKDSIELPFN